MFKLSINGKYKTSFDTLPDAVTEAENIALGTQGIKPVCSVNLNAQDANMHVFVWEYREDYAQDDDLLILTIKEIK